MFRTLRRSLLHPLLRSLHSLLYCLLSCGLLASGAARAHHAVSMVYLPERMVSVSGVVEEFRFHNPHCVIFMTETNAAGEKRQWTIEWAGASALRHQGLSAELLKKGDAITATGFPARDGSAGMALQVLEFADGRPAIRPPDRSGAGE